ncbi:hypothetical protein ECEC1869_3566, partial [Escherichia coli EC1869]
MFLHSDQPLSEG